MSFFPFIFILEFCCKFISGERIVFVLHSSSPHAYSLIQFLGPATWECSSELGLTQGKFKLLSLCDNGAITQIQSLSQSLVQFLTRKLSVPSHRAWSSFFMPLDSGSSQSSFIRPPFMRTVSNHGPDFQP